MIEDFYQYTPYELGKEDKEKLLKKELIELTTKHMELCEPYRNIVSAMNRKPENIKTIEDIPFIPVRLFKEMDLLSVPREDVFKTMTSSGTTGQAVSKIFVDKETAMIQQKVMIRILSDYLGKKRLPILVVDTPSVVKNRSMFSARGAAILGLNVMASKMTYVLNDDMSLNYSVLDVFMQENSGKKFLIFGFTFIVWQHFYKQLCNSEKRYDMSEAWLDRKSVV